MGGNQSKRKGIRRSSLFGDLGDVNSVGLKRRPLLGGD